MLKLDIQDQIIEINSLENIEENYVILDDKRIALNLNTKQDYDLLSAA